MFGFFSVFAQTPPPPKKCMVNLYQKVLLGYFSQDIKMWPSHKVLNL